jgi:two-component system LytT family response regulator
MQFSFLVIDDEQLSRNYTCDLLAEFMPGAKVREAPSAKSAIALIQQEKPDVLFLDIKMPGTDGFDLLSLLPERDFEIVFITAHSHYAIKAIKEGACDYLMKPVKKVDFKETLQRACNRRKKAKELKEEQPAEDRYLDQKLVITFQQGMRMIPFRDIMYMKADNSYTTLFLSNKEKVITTKPINKFEKQLNQKWFFRIHKSYIINTHHLSAYSAKESNLAILTDGTKLLVSRYRLSDFLKHIRHKEEDAHEPI